jgi:cyclophilin family peptidyl-prolyl cis-trans isomerase
MAAGVAVLALVLALVLGGGDDGDGTAACPPAGGAAERTVEFDEPPPMCIDQALTYRATVATSRGEFTVELDGASAPVTVNNFVFLARHGFYDGIRFHRIIPGFVVQGGDPGTPSAGPGYQFDDELPDDGPPYYEIGSLTMANRGPDTNGSQFFIVTGPNGEALPPQYSRFGQVVDGLDVVLDIEATGTASGDPSEPTVIESVTIEES